MLRPEALGDLPEGPRGGDASEDGGLRVGDNAGLKGAKGGRDGGWR